MTKYGVFGGDVVEPGEGVCDTLIEEVPNKLVDLWQTSLDNRSECEFAFGIDKEDITTTQIEVGDETSISTSIEQSLIGQIEKRYKVGVIHTHPVGEGMVNGLFSPEDMSSHMWMSDTVSNFYTSLVLTRGGTDISDEYILFGLENRPDSSGFGDVQSEISRLNDEMQNATGPDRQVELLDEMNQVCKQVGDFCYETFRISFREAE